MKWLFARAAEALESGTSARVSTRLTGRIPSSWHMSGRPPSGRYYSNDPTVLRWSVGDQGSDAEAEPAGHLRLPAPVRAGHPEIPAVRGAGRVCRMGRPGRTQPDHLHPWDMESPLPLEPAGTTHVRLHSHCPPGLRRSSQGGTPRARRRRVFPKTSPSGRHPTRLAVALDDKASTSTRTALISSPTRTPPTTRARTATRTASTPNAIKAYKRHKERQAAEKRGVKPVMHLVVGVSPEWLGAGVHDPASPRVRRLLESAVQWGQRRARGRVRGKVRRGREGRWRRRRFLRTRPRVRRRPRQDHAQDGRAINVPSNSDKLRHGKPTLSNVRENKDTRIVRHPSIIDRAWIPQPSLFTKKNTPLSVRSPPSSTPSRATVTLFGPP